MSEDSANLARLALESIGQQLDPEAVPQDVDRSNNNKMQPNVSNVSSLDTQSYDLTSLNAAIGPSNRVSEPAIKLHGKGTAIQRPPAPVPNPSHNSVPTRASLFPDEAKPPTARNTTTNPTPAPQAHLSPPLVPLLIYVDNILTKTASRHNNPPHPTTPCIICSFTAFAAPIPSVFLPLSPCNHWVHYYCFIYHCTRLHDLRAKCTVCMTQLYNPDGINALTLATRTNIEMEDGKVKMGYLDRECGYSVFTDRQEYEADCAVIELQIGAAYHAWMARRNNHHGQAASSSSSPSALVLGYVPTPPTHSSSSSLATSPSSLPAVASASASAATPAVQFYSPKDPDDGSTNMVAVYHATLAHLEAMGRPRSKWLRFETRVGYLLWGTLVAVKVGRLVEEWEGDRVRGTEGWKAFEVGRREIMGRILGEVQGPRR